MQEDNYTEFKSSFSDAVIETLTAFANTKGGRVLINEGLNEGLKSLLATIANNPGVQAKDIPALLQNRPLKTIERQIKELVVKQLIERRGSRKTGGYWAIKEDAK